MTSEKLHRSDCSVNNAPAEEPGPCDCEGVAGQDEIAMLRAECDRLRFGLRYWRDQYIGATVDTAIAHETWVGVVRAAFVEGYRKADETSAPAYLAWEMSDAFEAVAAQGIEAGTDETLQAAQPVGQEPGGVAMRPDTVTPSSQDTDQ